MLIEQDTIGGLYEPHFSEANMRSICTVFNDKTFALFDTGQ